MQLKRKQLMQLNGTLFLVIALVHLLRILNEWNVVVAEVSVPQWLSYVVVLLTAYLCYENWNQAK